jgi:hypothetical protein
LGGRRGFGGSGRGDLFGFDDRFEGECLDEDSVESFIVVLLDFEVRLAVDIAVVFPARLIKFDPDVLIGFPFYFPNESDGASFVWDFFGADGDFLAYFEAIVHLNMMVRYIDMILSPRNH